MNAQDLSGLWPSLPRDPVQKHTRRGGALGPELLPALPAFPSRWALTDRVILTTKACGRIERESREQLQETDV